MFTKILIANRGEIACRIIKTARRMGIATVAVYSDADRAAKHVAEADEAVYIGAAMATESYLNGAAIIDACLKTHAEAVHPGYGFLSENAEFSRALESAGIVFIGPGPEAIAAMGDKIASKKLATEAGVNTIPGHSEVIGSASEAGEISDSIGYPVMIKASAGGGGKGMHIANNREEAESGFSRATREALASFGDQRVFIEKFIVAPRHIEIQVLADRHGNAITLNERECSIQRRHQKVIEETPSPFMNEETRAAMNAQAIMLTKAVNYYSAGTVEMVVDAEHNFYFLEMNTRLQVEHPVTEMVTGVDLVELMIRVAANEPLPIQQQDITSKGWAMEARVYAENPFRNFLPSSGRLVHYSPPAVTVNIEDGEFLAHHRSENPNCVIRIDDGVDEGDEISRFYDPMIAKLVVWGQDRLMVIRAMQSALNAYYIRGVDTNLPFVSALFSHPRFQLGDFNTGFIEQVYPDGFPQTDATPLDKDDTDIKVLIAVVASLHHCEHQRSSNLHEQSLDEHNTLNKKWVLYIQHEYYPVSVRGKLGEWRVEYAGSEYLIQYPWQTIQSVFECQVNGNQLTMQLDKLGLDYSLTHKGKQIVVKAFSPRTAELHALMPQKMPTDMSRFLLSPMPGLLVSLSVKAGSPVKAGQELAVIEAMKMENSLRAEQDGVVKKVIVESGSTLEAEQVILEFEDSDTANNSPAQQ